MQPDLSWIKDFLAGGDETLLLTNLEIAFGKGDFKLDEYQSVAHLLENYDPSKKVTAKPIATIVDTTQKRLDELDLERINREIKYKTSLDFDLTNLDLLAVKSDGLYIHTILNSRQNKALVFYARFDLPKS